MSLCCSRKSQRFPKSLTTKMASNITPEHLQGVFSHENTGKRKVLLAEILDFGEFDEEDDFRTAILLDVYHENLLFAVKIGFPWRQVCSFFNLIRELLNNTKGQSLKEAINVFTESLRTCGQQFSENNLKSLIDYVFSTFFQHYKLYQYVLTRDRQEDRTNYHLIVQPPPVDVPSFGEGVPKTEWDERMRLKDIDEEEQRRNQARCVFYEKERERVKQQLEEPFAQLELSEEPLNVEQLTKVIRDAAAAHTSYTGAALLENIDEIHDSLEYKYKRANVESEHQQSRKSGSSVSRKNRTGRK